MAKERKDNWTKEHDDLLGKIVLEHLANGSTQTKAFEEAAEKLNRTAAACGYRWNAALRKEYKTEIKEVKTKKVQDSKFTKQKKATKPSLKEVKAEKPASKATSTKKKEAKQTTGKTSKKDIVTSATTTNEKDVNVSEIKIKHIMSAFENVDKELPIAALEQIQKENEALLKENQELKEEIRSVYIILDRLRRSANIDITKEQREAN